MIKPENLEFRLYEEPILSHYGTLIGYLRVVTDWGSITIEIILRGEHEVKLRIPPRVQINDIPLAGIKRQAQKVVNQHLNLEP